MDRVSRGSALTRAIQGQIKHHITANHLKPGDLLPPEAQLAAKLGVNRGTVREAIRALESLGIVEVRHGTGVAVREFNFDSVFDLLTFGLVFDQTKIVEILQVRKWLETSAIGEVVDRIDDTVLLELEDVLAEWEGKARAGQPAAEEDRRFHRLLYRSLGNQALVSLLDVFWLVFHSVDIQTIITDRQPTTTVHDHRAIVAAIRRNDAAAATKCMAEHFRALEARIAAAMIPHL